MSLRLYAPELTSRPSYPSRKGMSHGAWTDMRRDRTLATIRGMADERGLLCEASDPAISRANGAATATAVRWHLNRLEDAGGIAIYRRRPGSTKQVIVFRDHPEADATIAAFERDGYVRKHPPYEYEDDGPSYREWLESLLAREIDRRQASLKMG